MQTITLHPLDNMVTGEGFEPAFLSYEDSELPLLYPAYNEQFILMLRSPISQLDYPRFGVSYDFCAYFCYLLYDIKFHLLRLYFIIVSL